MLIGRSSINSVVATALAALCFGACAPALQAQTDDSGSKELRPPTKTAEAAPCISWMPPDNVKPRAAMLCIHGFSLHKGCYTAFGKEMAKDGIATYALDLRGFGESKDSTGGHTQLDFDGFLVDIKAELEQIHKNHPGLPVIILGESMGGAVALRATALYPQLVSGLISSVPARDRFAFSESERKMLVKSGLQSVFGGFSKPMDNAAMSAVQKISDKPELRDQWKSDPLMRTDFSPKEFLQFDEFMAHNLEAASMVKNTPVLFIQGTNDKLIRPAGTWKLFERLSTPDRQMVLSSNSEHLIFEEGQFRPDDLSFVLTWIDKNVTHLDPQVVSSLDKLPVVASKEEYAGTGTQLADAGNPEHAANSEALAAIPPAPPATEFKHQIGSEDARKISYWIELYRNGKVYRCNNKMEFKSGDSIRFHVIPECDGYTYLVMRASTTGKSDVLFPNATNGTHNYMQKGKDYPIPATGWMQFDQHPGTELLGLVFGQEKMDVTPEMLKNPSLTCYVSRDLEGSKDLCPTRMKLSWDDPTPVMIPDDFSPVSQVASSSDSSLVRLVTTNGEIVSANIQLLHGK
jgi:alpha-beta hydrolase superfamily lysophospholipase